MLESTNMINLKKKRKNLIDADERWVRIVGYVVLSLMALCAIGPLLMLISSSISSENALTIHGYGFFPREISFDSYRYMWAMRVQIGKAYLISIIVTVVGTSLSILITSMLAYGLVQKNVPGIKIVMMLMIITMLFSGGLVSSYIMWTNIFQIKNTIFSLILPNLLMNGFTVILVMSYYRVSISAELLEAARIDGAGEFYIYIKIMLPLSTPILATVGLMSALAYWNDWTNGLYYIDDLHSGLFSIQLLLNKMNASIDFLSKNPDVADQVGDIELPSIAVRMAIAFIGVLPILVAYPFFQKYFAAGLTLGGVKG